VYNTSNSGLPDNWVLSIAIDSSENKWIGTQYGLVAFDGSNWTVYSPSNSGLNNSWAKYIVIDTKGNKWIGTQYGLSVYKGNVISIVDKKNNVLPNGFMLYQNYPNPFNPTTTIDYSIPKESFVTIKVYDALGREVTTLVSEEKNTGEYSVKFNGSKLASGIYFYKITAGSFVQTKKMILMK
jgi:ligand-binding sensor domain-containing protein